MLRSTDLPPKHGARAMVAIIVLVPAVVALTLTAFAWPSARLAPRDLPVGVAGPPQAAAAIQRQLAQRGDAFDVRLYADQVAARAAIADRAVYGSIVAAPSGVTVLTASAASPVVSQLLAQAAAAASQGLGAAQGGASAGPAATQGGTSAGRVPAGTTPGGREPRVVDVVPADPDDPRGA